MVDLSNYTFADWMNFTFGHPVDLNRPWFSGEFFLYDFDSKLILEHLTSFFSRPELERKVGIRPPEIFTMGRALDPRALCYTVGDFTRCFGGR